MDAVLRVKALTKSYKEHQVLRGVDMELPRGSIYGLVGRNGAGKTTLIRLICGLQRPDGGCYELFGEKNDSRGIVPVRRKTGAVVEVPSIYQELSAEDNLRAQYKVLGRKEIETIPALLALVDLEGTGKKKAKDFSLGMRQRLGIAMALAGEPEFLILDEPTNGLDPQGIIEVRELLRTLNREKGITLLISSHLLSELSRLATHYGFLEDGKILRQVTADKVGEDLESYYMDVVGGGKHE